ncbi:hypothetical protein KCP76_23840 [Salmonella enterica subsp. enterica serovar Weltevreden]|nr:hypothetical protein KCP76_23840 [Salmonella enterica subsp. enterica serovar Weltevreden]
MPARPCRRNDGELVDASTCRHCGTAVTCARYALADGQRVAVAAVTPERVRRCLLAQYSEQCGVPEAQIIALAETFTSSRRT